MSSEIKGHIVDRYTTRGGETVWLVDWDDKAKRPPVNVTAAPDLRVGQRVVLIGDQLVPLQRTTA